MAQTALQDKKLHSLIRNTVVEIVQEILGDPDYGLELRPDFIKRLRKSIKSKKEGKTIPFDEIVKKYS